MTVGIFHMFTQERSCHRNKQTNLTLYFLPGHPMSGALPERQHKESPDKPLETKHCSDHHKGQESNTGSAALSPVTPFHKIPALAGRRPSPHTGLCRLALFSPGTPSLLRLRPMFARAATRDRHKLGDLKQRSFTLSRVWGQAPNSRCGQASPSSGSSGKDPFLTSSRD